MQCVRCKKRMAVVFISRLENGKTINEGLCLKCAKEMGIKPVDDIMQKMGITEDDIDNISNEISEVMEQNGEDFMPGGAASFPFLENLFGKGNGENDITAMPSKEKEKEQTQNEEKKDYKKSIKRKYLDTYCINLTEKAKEGKIDNIIGRDEEIYRVIQILNRRTKNNPCLIGEPGVGKTAIAEGLAQRLAEGKAPAKLIDKEVHLLDLTSLIAGTQFRGQFESRIKGLIDEVKKLGNIILVIDEVHNLVGTGDAEGSMNAANMLKPSLSRGEIQVIGATTLTEYRKYIEKDAALERRFQPVIVNEPSIDDTVRILRGIKTYYENYHSVIISDALIRQAVILSERYVTDRYLPDKAIDLIDEACSNASIKNKASNDLYMLRKHHAEILSELDSLSQLQTEESYRRIAELKAEECRISDREKELNEKALISVTTMDFARVIELWTGIPAGKIIESETQKLANLEEHIKEKIIGQDEAISLIATAVRRARAALTPRKRPISFIFTGPTGVGKTELVKVLSNELFDSPETLIRLDMSEFMEKHSVSRIIGSPPGYVGYDEAGQLTEKIRRKPYSVILFDEIEKAHPDVLNILLQVLDEGRITDSHGKTVSFEHTIIIMTSNAGSNIKGSAAGFNRSADVLVKEKTQKALSDFLRPEFLNRVDEIVVFSPLPKELFNKIAALRLNELKNGLAERDIVFNWDSSVEDYLADKSYSAVYGARNVRRIVQKEIEDKLVSLFIESGQELKEIYATTQNGSVSIISK